MDNRLEKIMKLLSHYASGNYGHAELVSSNGGELDSIIMGINMLGEELTKTAVSKSYFNEIYNSVSDMLFVVDQQGNILDINTRVIEKLGYDLEILEGAPLRGLFVDDNSFNFFRLSRMVNRGEKVQGIEEIMCNSDELELSVNVSMSSLKLNDKDHYLIVARDVSEQKDADDRIRKTIVTTQEKERQRVAGELHDSIGQNISAIKLYLGALKNVLGDDRFEKDISDLFEKFNVTINNTLSELNSICFDLMPKEIQDRGLIYGVEEMIDRLNINKNMKINFSFEGHSKKLNYEVEISAFRIIQEFINNSLKYSYAKLIEVKLVYSQKYLGLFLSDNGIGFDISKVKKGMGIDGIRARIDTLGGKHTFYSKEGYGTKMDILLPIINYQYERNKFTYR